MHTEKPRKTRSDKGLILVTDRDQHCLQWIADQYAVRFDQIQRLLTRWPGAPLKGKLIAPTTVKDQISRWKRAGWIEYRRVLADEPGWAWITKRGLQVIGWDDFYTAKVPASTRLNHLYAVNHLRLFLDKGFSWISEREYRTTLEAGKKGKTTGPIPDAIISNEKEGKIALEVELTPKKSDDLHAKLIRLVRADGFDPGTMNYGPVFPTVWFYVPNERLEKLVRSTIDRLPENERGRVAVGVEKRLISQ